MYLHYIFKYILHVYIEIKIFFLYIYLVLIGISKLSHVPGV